MTLLRTWWRRLFPPAPPVPPRPRLRDPGYVDWVARYHWHPDVRACAAQTLADAARRQNEDDRIRRIVAEELARHSEPRP